MHATYVRNNKKLLEPHVKVETKPRQQHRATKKIKFLAVRKKDDRRMYKIDGMSYYKEK